jgi:outer membrane protein assembly factor BamB
VAQPVAIEGDVLIASTDGRLYRLRRRSGRKIWAVDIPGKGSVLQAPSISGSKIFIATMENRLAAIDAKTGAVLWDRRRPQQGQFTITGHAGVLIDGSTVVTGFNDGWLIGFSQADGATLWSTDLSAGSQGFVDVDTTPLLYEGMFIVGSHGYGLFALDHVSQDVKWTLKGEGFLSPVIAGGTLYAATGRGDVVAVDAKSGKLLWKRHYSDELTTSPIATRKYLLLPTSAGLYVLDRRSGRVLERVGDSHGFSARPVFVGATLYALANSGRFYALGIY